MILRLLLSSTVLLFIGAVNTQAALMTSAYEAQLEAWLGEGDLVFTKIYTKQTTQSSDFHAAVDNQGRTITLMQIVSVEGDSSSSTPGVGNVVGGYNPLSWTSLPPGYNSPLDRNAFIFNLTTNLKLDQRTGGYGTNQTYNHPNFGPAFGGTGFEQFDLAVNSNLTDGSMKQYSYGDPSPQPFIGGPNLIGHTDITDPESVVTFGEIEVFTLSSPSTSATTAPEPGSLAVIGIGVLGMIAGGRRGRRRALPAE